MKKVTIVIWACVVVLDFVNIARGVPPNLSHQFFAAMNALLVLVFLLREEARS